MCLGKWVYLVTHAMPLFDLRDVCMVIGSLATLDLPMVVDLIGIFVLKGPYRTLTMTNWFLQGPNCYFGLGGPKNCFRIITLSFLNYVDRSDLIVDRDYDEATVMDLKASLLRRRPPPCAAACCRRWTCSDRHDEEISACSFFLFPVYAFILKILGFVAKYVCRPNSEGNDSYFSADHSKKGDEVVSKKSTVFLSSGLAEKGSSESETLDEINSKTEESVFMEAELVSSNSKYQFMPREDVSGFIEKPEIVKFHGEELFVGSNDALSCSDQSLDYENSPKIEYLEQKLEENILEFDKELEFIDQEKIESSAICLCDENDSATMDDKNPRFELIQSMEAESMEDQDFSYEIELFPRSKISTLGAKRSSSFSEFKFLVGPQKVESNHKAFLEADEHRRPEDTGTNMEEGINQARFDSDDEYIELEPARVNPANVNQESFASEESEETKELNEPERLDRRRDEGNSRGSELNDETEPDALWEHQHLVQQMKMELKNCRSGGLPTISEDCETPKMVEDLKPLTFDQKFEYKDLMEEIHKFYRTYAEKMRKLDVLNFQTLQAISFFQQKDSELFTSGRKKSASMLKQFTLQKVWPGKVQRIHADPTLRSIVELSRELELVYIGQLCLSWEILSWLYMKAQELLQYDSQGNHSYNRAVEEFQQFQVLMQRFIEDEPFQGPRVQNYSKNRCMIRSLLQVPLIRDDCVKDKKEIGEEKDLIPVEFLVRTIKESMVVFREFLHSDKSSKDHGAKIDTKDPEICALLADIITTLQKKERRLKENVRSKSCIVKMMQKQEESDQICTCEVELRLVSKVIGLSKVSRDQLIWCQNKLSNINFVSRRRVHLEPSFLLFPC
ncbi:hypothetical protein F511_17765 [Dorcoceras hygrometricum]|uniref:Ribosomal protein L34Ae n=1 Tax=Dorcoceras hygrometricum TaxID=472368 RepID=A0A2Z7APA8_9LAMI|nr:hypothetical protein F511_17765 [Dorcoceras hygrometricum]